MSKAALPGSYWRNRRTLLIVFAIGAVVFGLVFFSQGFFSQAFAHASPLHSAPARHSRRLSSDSAGYQLFSARYKDPLMRSFFNP